MTDGRIYREAGNLDHPAKFVGYNVYSPDPAGDRLFRSTPYRKNFTEDDELPNDALDTYGILPRARICEHLDPHTAATTQGSTFADHLGQGCTPSSTPCSGRTPSESLGPPCWACT